MELKFLLLWSSLLISNSFLASFAAENATQSLTGIRLAEQQLISAASRGELNRIILLQSPLINMNAQDSEGITALMSATSHGCEAIVQLLLDNSSTDINVQDVAGFTALMLAAQNGHTEIVRLLLKKPGINVNVQNKKGETALLLAVLNWRRDIIQLLVPRSVLDDRMTHTLKQMGY